MCFSPLVIEIDFFVGGFALTMSATKKRIKKMIDTQAIICYDRDRKSVLIEQSAEKAASRCMPIV